MKHLLMLLSVLCLVPATALAEGKKDSENILLELEELGESVEKLKLRVESLEKENTELKQKTQTDGDVSTAGTNRRKLQLNPDIGLLGDIVAASSESSVDEEGNDKISVRHVELMIGHDVDPFSRFDSTISFSDIEDVEIEEAFISHWGLSPLSLKLGRMRQRIGYATAIHRDSLETVDEPLVVQRYLGIEGLFRTGLEVSGFIPTPWETVTQEIIAGVMEGGVGEEGELFGETRRRPSYYAGLRNSWDVSDKTAFDVAGTYLIGSSDDDSKYEVHAFGAHARLTHYFNSINRLKFQSEGYFQDRDEVALEPEGHGHGEDEHDDETEEDEEHFDEEAILRSSPFGYYALADYRVSPSWSTGLRYDAVETTNEIVRADDKDIAYTAYLTFHQSEFARWRLQYQHLDAAEGDDDDRLWLQATVAIGVHKHQLQ